jgi:para-nitrobenzyl esterase
MTTRQEPVIAATGGRLGAFHGLDLPFVVACRGESVRPFTDLTGRPSPAELVAAVHGAWVTFMAEGVPAHAGLPSWPRYDLDRRATMVFDDVSSVVPDPWPAGRRIWRDVEF